MPLLLLLHLSLLLWLCLPPPLLRRLLLLLLLLRLPLRTRCRRCRRLLRRRLAARVCVLPSEESGRQLGQPGRLYHGGVASVLPGGAHLGGVRAETRRG